MSLAALVTSVALLAQAIAAYQAREGRRQFYYSPIESAEFSFRGLPVRVREEVDDLGRGQVIVAYAQAELRLEVQIPNPNPLPLIVRQQDWFRIMAWADGTGMNADEFEEARRTGERPEHVVIVTRSLAPGSPAGSWGDIWRGEWVFNIYSLVPPAPSADADPAASPSAGQGGFEHERWEYPESPRAYNRRVDAARLRGDPVPERNPRELREGTWQHGAAMLVMPSGSAPPYTFNRGVLLENRHLVAIASIAILALMVSVAIALAPSRPGPTPRRTRSASE
ncbi:MAG: hypothetical protein KDA05_02975 [Phycisphaerales bacterium]|nr:hypothetical protein [Phycisphaerales bacterium]